MAEYFSLKLSPYYLRNTLSLQKWEYIVPVSQLQPGYKTSCHNYFTVKSRKTFTHLRLNIYPGILIMNQSVKS